MSFPPSPGAPAVHAVPGVWVHTTLEPFNLFPAGDRPAFLPAEDRARLERIRQARLLIDGRHRQYFLDERRTQFAFPQVRAEENRLHPLYLTYNVLGLISFKSADLVFGQEPIFRASHPAQQSALDA